MGEYNTCSKCVYWVHGVCQITGERKNDTVCSKSVKKTSERVKRKICGRSKGGRPAGRLHVKNKKKEGKNLSLIHI